MIVSYPSCTHVCIIVVDGDDDIVSGSIIITESGNTITDESGNPLAVE